MYLFKTTGSTVLL